MLSTQRRYLKRFNDRNSNVTDQETYSKIFNIITAGYQFGDATIVIRNNSKSNYKVIKASKYVQVK